MNAFGTLETLSVLVNPLVKDIFTFILRSKGVSRYELQIKENVPDDQLQSAIDDLVRAGLVGTSSAAIRDFDKFYPTGSGLAAEKLVL